MNPDSVSADQINTTDFVTTWRISDPVSTSITIPTTGGGYNYNVDWDNDGIVDSSGLTGDATHDFGGTGDFTIRISGTFPRIYTWELSVSEAAKLVDINQWGTNPWMSMNGAFVNTKLTTLSASDTPNLDGVTTLANMFYQARAFNSSLADWDVSNITDMSNMFNNANAFNGDISTWDVSGVTSMNSMFSYATVFNGDISGWDVGSVANMSWMFNNANAFNSDISTWDVSGVTDMSYMFYFSRAFNKNLSNWDVSNVANMTSVFGYAGVFSGDISGWDVSGVTNMGNMFQGASSFNGDISGWDVGNVTNMSYMFSNTNSFNKDLSNWDVSKVAYMNNMFSSARAFNGDISAWDVSSVTNMSSMFNSANVFNSDISTWDVSSVTNMNSMFAYAYAFNSNLSDWDVSSVTNMSSMFTSASAFTGTISSWDVSNVTNMSSMFMNASKFNSDLSTWDVSKVTDMNSMFQGASAFNGDVSSWNTSSVTNMSYMFFIAGAFNGDISGWSVSNVTNMNYMFYLAAHFNKNLASWDVGKVISMDSIFNSSGLNVANYDDTLIGWSQRASLRTGVLVGASGRVYCASQSARQYLITTFGWTFSGDTQCAAPSVPTSLSVIPDAYSVSLSWQYNYANSNTIIDYQIEYSTNAGASWTTYTRSASSALTAEVTGLIPNTAYSFRVAAVNGRGTGSATAASQTVTLTTIPDAPIGLTADPVAYGVMLEWFAPLRDGGNTIIDYQIEYSTNAGASWTTYTRSASSALTAEVPQLYKDLSYSFRVTAVNNVGRSQSSNIAIATPIIIPAAIYSQEQSLSTAPTLIKRPVFSGTTVPLSLVVIIVHSNPVVCSTTADEDGVWSCELQEDLEPGAHEVFVVLTLPDGTIQEIGPYAVTVETLKSIENHPLISQTQSRFKDDSTSYAYVTEAGKDKAGGNEEMLPHTSIELPSGNSSANDELNSSKPALRDWNIKVVITLVGLLVAGLVAYGVWRYRRV